MKIKDDGKSLTRAEAKEFVAEVALGALATAFDYTLEASLKYAVPNGEKMSKKSSARIARERDLLVKHLRTRALNARLQQRKEIERGKQE